jgi:hypothetical protein
MEGDLQLNIPNRGECVKINNKSMTLLKIHLIKSCFQKADIQKLYQICILHLTESASERINNANSQDFLTVDAGK